MTDPKKDKTIAIRFDQEEEAALRRAADQEGVPMSIFVRQAVKKKIAGMPPDSDGGDLPSHVESVHTPPARKA